MSGVSVDTRPSFHPNTLAELLGSDESVAARLQRYETMKADAERALAELNLGREARAAYDDANAKQAEASAALDRAQEDAEAARAVLAEATARAKKTIALAEAAAAKLKSEADIYAARAIAAADALQREAKDQHDAVEHALEEARTTKADALAAQAKAAEAELVANLSRAECEAAKTRLENALRTLTGDSA